MRIFLCQRGGCSIQYPITDDSSGVPGECHPSCRHLIENRTEGEEVRPCIQFFATRLFRRHVNQCARYRAGAGCNKLFHRSSLPADYPASGAYLCQTEIENLGVTPLGNKNVRWLCIAVDDAFGVGGFEGLRNFNPPLNYLLKRERLSFDAVL